MKYQEDWGESITKQNIDGRANQFQGFSTWKYRPVENLSLVTGFHVQKISMNDQLSFEPRASFRWQFHPRHAVTAGFGIHGKMEALPNYYSVVYADGHPTMPNKKLEISKARHYVVGYESKLSQNLLLKLEGYYQQLYNIPVENNSASSYSLINVTDGFTDRILVNMGTGTNIGIELTLERYFADNYYFLVTASLFDSKYIALDGVERNTAFNGNVVGNILFGKDWQLKSVKQKNNVFGFNVKISSLGGRRYTPINLEESIVKNETVFYNDQAFSKKGENIFMANIAIVYRVDAKRISHEFKLDLQNATNNDAQLEYYYNSNQKKIESITQSPFVPVVMYAIHF